MLVYSNISKIKKQQKNNKKTTVSTSFFQGYVCQSFLRVI